MTEALYREYCDWLAGPIPSDLKETGLAPNGRGSVLMDFVSRINKRDLELYRDECARANRLSARYPVVSSPPMELFTSVAASVKLLHIVLRSGEGNEEAFRECILGVRRMRDILACHWSQIRLPDEEDVPEIGFPPSFTP
jgi:hypothetical protein